MKVTAVNDSRGHFIGVRIYCLGCKETHDLPTRQAPDGQVLSKYNASDATWEWNKRFDGITLSPSLLLRRGHFVDNGTKPGNCACDYQERFPDKEPWDWPCVRCHSYVRDGRIQYLDDCSHALAGQTIDLPEIPHDED